MRVLAHLHMYPPVHNAGAEWYAHTVLRDLVARGHEVQVLVATLKPYSFEGVEVTDEPGELYSWADVAITHLDRTRDAMILARRSRTPLVHIVHNDKQLRANHVKRPDAALVVFNSRWIAAQVGWTGPSLVVPPPVVASDYSTSPGDALTLVNLSEAKGALMFYDLAARLVDRRFLAVTGAYGTQRIAQLPNVTHQGQTPRMREEVYARTRVLLMPSRYESWGRVAVEAAASGIPTIAAPTPGLVEALGFAGIFCVREDLDAWEREIRRLDDPACYAEAEARARARSAELDPADDLERLETALLKVRRPSQRPTSPAPRP